MTLARTAALALLFATGFALSAARAAQPPAPEKATISQLREDFPNGLTPEDGAKARETFQKAAKVYADWVSDVNKFKASQEFSTSGITIDWDRTPFDELNRQLIIEGRDPFYTSNAKPKHAVYLAELGAAHDEALKRIIEDPKREPIVRVNAARLLAHVCRAGSPAHYATLTELIGNPKTRTEVKYYLLQAAGHLIAAPDLEYPKTRNHPGQTTKPDLVFGLIKALEGCVTNPALVLFGLPADKPQAMTFEQAEVVALVRRQALKALSRARYVAYRSKDDQMTYPAHTLARVALSDPALVPAPGPADAAEAAIGLMNMSPTFAKGDKRFPAEYNAAAAVEAVTAGLQRFAGERASDDGGRTLPWRGYALRLGEALHNWRFLFDIGYDPGGAVQFNPATVPAAVESLRKEVPPAILAPLSNNNPPDNKGLDALAARLRTLRADPNRKTTLFEGVPQTSIAFAAPK